MNIHVHIERLIVDGVDVGASGAIDLHLAMQSRLTQLLMEHGLPSDLSKTAWIPSAQAHTLSITRRMDGAALGSSIAESLHSGFQTENTRPGTHGSISPRG